MEGRKKLTVTAAEAGGHYGDLSLTLVWWPEGALLEVEVLCAMEDGCVLGWESDGRHCEWESRDGCGGGGGRLTERTGTKPGRGFIDERWRRERERISNDMAR